MRRIVSGGGPMAAPRPRLLAAIVAGLGVSGQAGCATVHPTESGFLPDYSRLTPTTDWLNWGGGFHSVRVYVAESGGLEGIDSFYVQPVEWVAKEKDWLGEDDDRRKRVLAALDGSLRKKLGAIRPIVEAPGPKTARVRAAVTDVISPRPVVNAITSILVGPFTNGGASVEVEVVAPDGAQIAAVDGSSAGGFFDVIGYYTRSGHPNTATRRLAGEMVEALEGTKVR